MEREMVLIPTDSQFNEKTEELMIGECYWTIPMYPKFPDKLVGSKIYFYDKAYNKIIYQATVTGFDEVDVKDDWGYITGRKKAVFFELNEGDGEIKIDLEKMGIEERRQNRGWCYKFW